MGLITPDTINTSAPVSRKRAQYLLDAYREGDLLSPEVFQKVQIIADEIREYGIASAIPEAQQEQNEPLPEAAVA